MKSWIDEVDVTAPRSSRDDRSVDSEFVDGEPPPDEAVDAPAEDALTAEVEDDAETDAEDAAAAPYVPKQGDTFVKDDNTQIILDPNEDPFVHGFVGNLIGVERGSDVEFELTIPDDDAEETIIGRRVSFIVTIKDIEAISIPELDDDFARRVSRDRGDEEQDVAGLRKSLLESLEVTAADEARSEYSARVLQSIVDGAEIEYPDLMLDERIDDMIREFAANLQQRGLNLEEYLRLTNSTMDDLRDQYREGAADSLRQTLVLRELVRAQEVEITDDDLALRLDNAIAGYGTNPEIRKLFESPQMRDNIRNELVMRHVDAHIVAIGQGQDPAAAIENLRSKMTDDADRARERAERLQRYRDEDAASEEDESPDFAASCRERGNRGWRLAV